LFDIFPTAQAKESIYKTTKYRLLLLEVVSVTSNERTNSIAFAYMISDKEDNITWALERCHDLLKSIDNHLKRIVSD